MERQKKPKSNTKFIRNLVVVLLVFFIGVTVGTQNPALLDDLTGGQPAQNQDLPKKLNYDGVEEVYSKLRSNFDGDLNQKKLQNGLKSGLVKAAGDPYTEYLNAKESKAFESDLNGSFEGIGAELGKDKQSIVIVAPLEGFPAEKAGLKPKDIIAEIDGDNAYDLSIEEAVQKIRGPKGTSVKLGVIRDGKSMEFDITRAQITVPSVKSKVVDGNIGIIEISRFGEDTISLADKYARELKTKNVSGVVLDLRGNPGGLLESAVGVSELWLNKGDMILQEKRGGEVIKTYLAEGDPVLNNVPTVVLINEGSASASEITAGALRDNGVATLIGQKSYGKGSVQEVITLSFGGALKVTVARWFTPNGRNIDEQGIKPDKKVKLTEADAKAERDPQQQAAIQQLKQQ